MKTCTDHCTSPSLSCCSLAVHPKATQAQEKSLPASCPCTITRLLCAVVWQPIPGSRSLLCPSGRVALSQSAAHTGITILPLLLLQLQAPASLHFVCKLFPNALSRAGIRATNHGAHLLPSPFPFTGRGSSAAGLPQPELHEPSRKTLNWEDSWCHPLLFWRLGFQYFYVL